VAKRIARIASNKIQILSAISTTILQNHKQEKPLIPATA